MKIIDDIGLYTLGPDHEVIRATDVIEWAKAFENDGKRLVAQETEGEFFISTVFLGINMAFFDGPPMVFETMVFDTERQSVDMERYASWEDAEAGHKMIIERVKRGEYNSRVN